MDVDQYEKEYENIISYNCDFIHDIHLLLSPISSLIQCICDDVTMIEVDYLSINIYAEIIFFFYHPFFIVHLLTSIS